MTIKLLLGLAGPARAGKSTAQGIIADRFGLARVNFADPIKDALAAMLWLDERHLAGELKEKPLGWLPHSPRELMQTLGTEWGRELYGTGFWTTVAQQRLARLEDIEGERFQGAVFSDVRFESEARWIRNHGGTVIHLQRNDAQPVRSHPSEAGIPLKHGDLIVANNGDLIVANNGDLDELRSRLTQAVDSLIDARVAAHSG
ncbi:deoxynucleotide monophosphate kinase [Billgrantia azerbaijanica]|nr:deoxynucleotide monophosphate kinase [Halomonas azerbaijanica]